MSTGRRVEIGVLFIMILMICATSGISAVPGQINFQGRLTDATGEPAEIPIARYSCVTLISLPPW